MKSLKQRRYTNKHVTIRRLPERRLVGASAEVERPSERHFPAGENTSDGSSEERSGLAENKTTDTHISRSSTSDQSHFSCSLRKCSVWRTKSFSQVYLSFMQLGMGVFRGSVMGSNPPNKCFTVIKAQNFRKIQPNTMQSPVKILNPHPKSFLCMPLKLNRLI